MKNIFKLLIILIFTNCNKSDEFSNLNRVQLLAINYQFLIDNNSAESMKFNTIKELENFMIKFNEQKKYIIKTTTDSKINSDTSYINKKINELKLAKIVILSDPKQDVTSNEIDDPIYKYSKILYFRNSGLLPNYAVNIQYNAINGKLTGINISVNPYGSYYYAGQFTNLGQPQIYYLNGSLAFLIRTSMTYTLNFPGVPYLGLSSTVYSQFNGYLQLDENNNMTGSGFQNPYDPDALKYK